MSFCYFADFIPVKETNTPKTGNVKDSGFGGSIMVPPSRDGENIPVEMIGKNGDLDHNPCVSRPCPFVLPTSILAFQGAILAFRDHVLLLFYIFYTGQRNKYTENRQRKGQWFW
jgi:hypothetical protein